MALSSETLDAVAALAAARFAAGETISTVVHAVKDAHPGLLVTGTFASIMAEEPYREEGLCALFLVDGHNHCWTITADPKAATGLVVALRDEDD
ncbi:hypothetical protein [Azospirillum halopraeferens]|uniref:hypothetical protein n=1 Tax=Azospirillum halopraeferens TaxID=34010 RepID=UPI00042526BE|nr:hypothetical protein [Azospirillum halopraeferens]